MWKDFPAPTRPSPIAPIWAIPSGSSASTLLTSGTAGHGNPGSSGPGRIGHGITATGCASGRRRRRASSFRKPPASRTLTRGRPWPRGPTRVQAITRVLGEDYALEAPVSTFMAKREGIPNDIARLASARLVVASESDHGRRLNEALVKQLTGGDKITARFLHQEYFSFTPTFTLILTTNHKPEIRGTDLAIWRRVRLVPFTHTIAEADQDEHFLEDTLLPEARGILAWLVAGCRAWQHEGLKAVPPTVKGATEAYRVESDLLADFLEERTTAGKDLFTTAAAVYEAYLGYSDKTKDKHALSRIELGRRLSEKGFTGKR